MTGAVHMKINLNMVVDRFVKPRTRNSGIHLCPYMDLYGLLRICMDWHVFIGMCRDLMLYLFDL